MSEHVWFTYLGDCYYETGKPRWSYATCIKCGVVKRRDGRNSKCRGKVKVVLRKDSDEKDLSIRERRFI